MYIPKHFDITDREEILAFIKANSFGQLISTVGGQLFSTHMPFLLSDDQSKLLGHVAKQNPQWQDIHDQAVLITLQGPHDYISPSWYKSPGVPTWNYQAVHIYGRCEVIRNPEQIKTIINTLTEKYESQFEKPWQANYQDVMLQAIVGLEITITEIQCKYKLSQNRSMEDQQNVLKELENTESVELAKAMQKSILNNS
jgi:transcriptional regulator